MWSQLDIISEEVSWLVQLTSLGAQHLCSDGHRAVGAGHFPGTGQESRNLRLPWGNHRLLPFSISPCSVLGSCTLLNILSGHEPEISFPSGCWMTEKGQGGPLMARISPQARKVGVLAKTTRGESWFGLAAALGGLGLCRVCAFDTNSQEGIPLDKWEGGLGREGMFLVQLPGKEGEVRGETM